MFEFVVDGARILEGGWATDLIILFLFFLIWNYESKWPSPFPGTWKRKVLPSLRGGRNVSSWSAIQARCYCTMRRTHKVIMTLSLKVWIYSYMCKVFYQSSTSNTWWHCQRARQRSVSRCRNVTSICELPMRSYGSSGSIFWHSWRTCNWKRHGSRSVNPSYRMAIRPAVQWIRGLIGQI